MWAIVGAIITSTYTPRSGLMRLSSAIQNAYRRALPSFSGKLASVRTQRQACGIDGVISTTHGTKCLVVDEATTSKIGWQGVGFT